MKAILSIDGGGIRGIIPALILEDLQKRLRKRKKTLPLYRYFDLISGTSTGGIIAAGLTCPHPENPKTAAATPADMVELYEKYGEEIFEKSIYKKFRKTITDLFNDPRSLVQEKYDAERLIYHLTERLGEAKISDALTGVVITAYDIEQRKGTFMTNLKDSKGKPSDVYKFWQAARATSAAPTFFEPARVMNYSTGKPETMVDGGVFANDPAMAAYVEARKSWRDDSEILMLSIGTGDADRPFEFVEARSWGSLGWINPANGAPIISIMMQGQASTAAYQANIVLNDAENSQYYRIQGELEASEEMDDASSGNIARLKLDAQRMIKDNSKTLEKIADLLEAS